MSLIIDTFICGADNYGYLVHDGASGKTASIDAPDADTILEALEMRGWTLSDILITHHHTDHTVGIAALKAAFPGAVVIGPEAEADKIEGLDETVRQGDVVLIGDVELAVLEAPGHTLGHVVYHDEAGGHLFTGDALFSIGVGRMFEGTPGPMWEGLDQIRSLPDSTLIYCGHEYTEANARFARSVDPDNVALRIREAEVKKLREAGQFTIPVSLAMENATNPFLRADRPELARAMGLPETVPPSAVFAALRKAKDTF